MMKTQIHTLLVDVASVAVVNLYGEQSVIGLSKESYCSAIRMSEYFNIILVYDESDLKSTVLADALRPFCNLIFPMGLVVESKNTGEHFFGLVSPKDSGEFIPFIHERMENAEEELLEDVQAEMR